MIGISIILFGFALSVGLFALFFGVVAKNKFLGQNNTQQPQNFLDPKKDDKLNDKFKISDEMVIRLAHHLNNRLCVEDLIKQTQMTSTEAKERLENLALKGICEIRINEVQTSGKIYYYFD